MAEIVTSVAAKLIEVLGADAINKVCDIWGYKTELQELQQTVSTVKAVLLDATAKWDQLSHQERDFIRKLRDVVYDADDVFDEFLTRAELNQLDGRLKKRGKIFKKVCRFFSSKNQVNEAYRMSCEVKDIKQRLDAIASDHAKFKFVVDLKPIRRRPEETCSYVNVNDIIGRDEDRDLIVNMLLAPSACENALDILTIVGVGGSGKTALAQLVFSDDKIKQEFPDPTFRLWVCVSDQDGLQFDDKAILCKILELITKVKPDNNLLKESIKNILEDKLGGKKFLLVLDDVWNEVREKWLALENFLRMGCGGSKILVTTRSQETATIIRSKHVHKLDGLSTEYSQRLFEMSAFGEGEKLENHIELVEIGKKIVETCYNIPLALKVVGSLLYSQDINRWRSIYESGLANIGNGDNGVLSVLKLSYHNLEPSLKSCFGYCAIFPKDVVIHKVLIIGFWLAQGYIVSFDRGQNLEDAAEEHFKILLRRCFFQDVETDEYGDVMSVKIHDLMHDVAQEVGQEEICIVTSKSYNIGDNIRHLYVGYKHLENFMGNKKVRSYIGHFGNFVDAHNLLHLRVLVLSQHTFISLPDSIGKLLHLRYLDLSKNNNLEVLCDSITKLYNLQTLDLSWCRELRELPKGISKLANLRNLNLDGCSALTSMPSGLDKLTQLKVLPLFVVGYKSIEIVKQSGEVGMLKDLTSLKNIQGSMRIKIGENYRNIEDINDNRGGYLKSMKYLRKLEIEFDSKNEDEDTETIMKLEPPPNLKKLVLKGFNGKIIRWWGTLEDNWAISPPLLVNIRISGCSKLEHLSMLSKLPHLKSLTLEKLDSLEYMENGKSHNTNALKTQFFSSLEYLKIFDLPQLKGWWKVETFSLYFPCLLTLEINYCPDLAANMICPTLKSLILGRNSERLQITYGTLQDDVIKMKTLAVSPMGHVKWIPRNCNDKEKENKLKEATSASFLQTLEVWGEVSEELGISEEEEEPWKSFQYSLRNLTFYNCKGMKRLPKGMQHLTSLKSLQLWKCKNMNEVPEWISCLSSLQSLQLWVCPYIKILPDAIRHLTSLKSLSIIGCPDLEERCRKPNGEDFPKIQHIPYLQIDYILVNKDEN